MRKQATSELLVDNDRVRVTRWHHAPGAATGWHVHELDYVIVTVVGSTVTIIGGGGGDTSVRIHPGDSIFGVVGTAHDVINSGPGELVYIETELKEPRK